MKKRFYIDVNSGVGRTGFRENGIPYKLETLLEDMKYYRIHASAIYNNVARDYAMTKGNEKLIKQVSSSDRLSGIAVAIPGLKYELEEGNEYYDNLLENGMKAFKIYPKTHRYDFNPFTMESLAEYMTDRKLPLFVEIKQVNWKNTAEMLQAFPELNIVLCGTAWGGNRDLFPLLDKYSNLYFEISSNQANDILLTTKKYFGIERALFGTDYPNKVMGALKCLVEYSELPEEDKDKVAHKNAMDLLNIQNVKPYSEKECRLDEIAKTVDEGRPLENINVIDSHTHIVETDHRTVNRCPMINSDSRNLIRKMDNLGIDKIMISSWEGLVTNGIAANETDLKAQRDYPERIEVYGMCNPLYEEDREAIIKYHEKYGFVGLKPYYSHNKYDILGEKYDEWFEYGNRNRLIMLVHSGPVEIAEKVAVLSEKYKDMVFLMAHSGISYKVADGNISVAKKRDNVYLEITYTSLTNGVIEYMVDQVGADKVLFGTDMPMRDPAPQFGWVCYARISVEDKKKILGGNIKNLLKRCYT